jgi:class 3 adenylate cyclase
MFIDSKGVFWIATGSDKTGLVRFDYKAIHKNSTPPTVVIQSIRVNEENICWYDMKLNSKEDKATGKPATVNVGSSDSIILSQQEIMTFGMALSQEIRDSIRKKFAGIRFDSITSFYPLPINLVLPYEHNNITFEFNAIEPGRHFSVRYQYILEGYNKEWSPVTEKTSATFGNIYDGTYTFKLKACNPDGIWSNPITYTFKVLPPWYRTWWMYSIYIIVIISVLFLVYRWRVASLRRRQKELVQEVRKVTAEIRKQNEEIILQRDEIDLQKKKSDELLLNILPSETAEELKKYGRSNAKPYDVVSVLFTDFEGFSKIAEKFSAEKLVTELSICFEAFDKLMEKYNVEKIKTIGDSYMCAGGIPVPNTTNPVDVVKCGLEIQQFMETYKEERIKKNEPYFELRIGIHTGPIVAGIVGLKKFSYDIWGDTVNIASRMESSGEVGKVNISGTTYELVKDIFVCTYRGKVQAKNKGEIDMYFVEKIITK